MKRTAWRLAFLTWIPVAFAGWVLTSWITWPVCLAAWIIRGRVPRWAHMNAVALLWLGTLDWILDRSRPVAVEATP